MADVVVSILGWFADFAAGYVVLGVVVSLVFLATLLPKFKIEVARKAVFDAADQARMTEAQEARRWVVFDEAWRAVAADDAAETVPIDELLREYEQYIGRLSWTQIAASKKSPFDWLTARLRLPRRKVRRDARAVLDVWAAFLPSRVATEDLGDYLEDINNRLAKGQRKLVYVRVAAAIFWTGINAVGYAMKAVGRKSAG
jgi:hypothetical protein